MRVLWFEVSVPGRYKSEKATVQGWQDSLQEIVAGQRDVELAIAFEYDEAVGEVKDIDGVRYYPLNTHYNFLERKRRGWSWDIVIEKVIPRAVAIINEFKPDIIHVFGSEWCFGLVAEITDIPVVIHMQGCIMPYRNTGFPPGFSRHDESKAIGWNLRERWHRLQAKHGSVSRANMERRIFKAVKYYMGRTDWDRSLVNLFHPGAKYYYCAEALRPSFIRNATPWTPPRNKTFRIVTVGTHFLKGIDTIHRTASILKDYGFCFEWIVVGSLFETSMKMVEKKEGASYESKNVSFVGTRNQDELHALLLSADLYVQPSYIDNSPNSLCEAQYLGLPCIATFAGGIPSLVENNVDGILVHTNAPYYLASKIIDLAKDDKRCVALGATARKHAMERHNPETILRDLMACYKDIISCCLQRDKKNDNHKGYD